jgi:serine/threonine protein kinase
LVHASKAKITDFGLSDKILELKAHTSGKETYPYFDPRCFYDNPIKQDRKSDIFSVGVVLWEISSSKHPCEEFKSDNDIRIHRLRGGREPPFPGTPKEYIELYSQCWDDNPEKRPSCEEINNRLTMARQQQMELNHDSICLYREDKSEAKSETQKHALSDELLNIYYKEELKGRSSDQIAFSIKKWLTDNNYSLYESFSIFESHTDCQQCIWLAGFFLNHGIGKDLDQAIYRYKLSARNGYKLAQNCLGWCHENGVGVETNKQKAVELYQKAADQEYTKAQFNLADCY